MFRYFFNILQSFKTTHCKMAALYGKMLGGAGCVIVDHGVLDDENPISEVMVIVFHNVSVDRKLAQSLIYAEVVTPLR